MIRWALLLCVFVLALAAQPNISPGGVLDAASYTEDIALGSVFVVKGQGLCPPGFVQASLPLPEVLNGVEVVFTAARGGAPVRAFMVYTYNLDGITQLAGILPSLSAEGPYNVTVRYNGQTSNAQQVTVVRRKFGIITVNSSGSGRAVIQNFISFSQLDLNRFGTGTIGSFTTSPARPGQTLILWGTGLGPAPGVADNVAPGVVDLLTRADIKVLVGGQEIRPFYAGRAPTLPGADQINFTLPANVPLGCSVPIQVSVDNVTSNPATLAIAPAGSEICTHPVFRADVLRRLDAGGTAVAGIFNLMGLTVSAGGAEVRGEQVAGGFARYTSENAADAAGTGATINSCVVLKRRGNQDSVIFGQPPVSLDAGAPLTVSGPGGLQQTVPRVPGGQYSQSLGAGTSYLGAGDFSLNGPGGADIGRFTATLRAPEPLIWTNRTAISEVNRTTGVTVNWSGGGATGLVTILGVSGVRVGGTTNDPIYDASVFACTVPALAGTFRVAPEVTRQLPETRGANALGLLVVMANTNGPAFNAPVTAGGAIDNGIFTISTGAARLVTWGPATRQ